VARNRRRAPIEKRRQLNHVATVEAAIAQGARLDVLEQVKAARNLSVYGGTMTTFAALCASPGALENLASGWGVFGGIASFLGVVLFRRAYLLQKTLGLLRDEADPALFAGDDEMAHLRQLVKSLESKGAQRAGRDALAAAQQGYAERRRVFERRCHIEALLEDADPNLGMTGLAEDLVIIDRELAEIDRRMLDLIEAVVDLADSSDDSHSGVINKVRDATDEVDALAEAWDELRGK
jgi:hypothetical protein